MFATVSALAPAIVGRDLNRGRHNLGILGDGQAIKANSAKQNRDDRDHVGKNRSLNEESRHARLNTKKPASSPVYAECVWAHKSVLKCCHDKLRFVGRHPRHEWRMMMTTRVELDNR